MTIKPKLNQTNVVIFGSIRAPDLARTCKSLDPKQQPAELPTATSFGYFCFIFHLSGKSRACAISLASGLGSAAIDSPGAKNQNQHWQSC
ncbi:hypothetical protein NPIL_505011 [Nephila pilipes]|uniref:Uncharacterized protein n=1 Tax=Nephila pilipes TaxID=299642 RepID=A0A8X6R7P4_NEPPI|nr:hypothetical protein NPIL_505011 [Nephila pilipes]